MGVGLFLISHGTVRVVFDSAKAASGLRNSYFARRSRRGQEGSRELGAAQFFGNERRMRMACRTHRFPCACLVRTRSTSWLHAARAHIYNGARAPSGERSLLSRKPVAASVIASTHTHMQLFTANDVHLLLEIFPEIIHNLFAHAVALDRFGRGTRNPSTSSIRTGRAARVTRRVASSVTRCSGDRTSLGDNKTAAVQVKNVQQSTWEELYLSVRNMNFTDAEVLKNPNDVRATAKLLVEGELLDDMGMRPTWVETTPPAGLALNEGGRGGKGASTRGADTRPCAKVQSDESFIAEMHALTEGTDGGSCSGASRRTATFAV